MSYNKLMCRVFTIAAEPKNFTTGKGLILFYNLATSLPVNNKLY